jgi:hypothetical protein
VKSIVAFVVALAAAAVLSQATRASSPVGTVAASAASAVRPCQAGDQDPYVYRPARLQLLHACLRVTGTVVASTVESDGDVHINVRLDPLYQGLLVEGNQFEDGYLIVEPVCQYAPLLGEAIRVCASDPDPLTGGLPAVGDHVWMEGRYILDLQHHAWAELHPLYRWGLQNP